MKIFLTGADGQGWAMDTERRLAEAALGPIVDLVDDPARADVLHTVWPDLLFKRRDLRHLRTMPTVATFENDPVALFEESPGFFDVASRWLCVAQSDDAFVKLRALGVPRVRQVPYVADLDSFFPIDRGDPRLATLRRELEIPDDVYVIANFQRDSEGGDLSRPKIQKAPDVFLAIVVALARQVGAGAFRVLLAGPRRHWIRERLDTHGIAYSYAGAVVSGDDYPQNILPMTTINLLTNIADVVLVTSRWEGAPRAILEAAACARPVLSTPVGVARDLLDGAAMYDSVDDAVTRLIGDMKQRTLGRHTAAHRARLETGHSVAAVSRGWAQVYGDLERSGLVGEPGARSGRVARAGNPNRAHPAAWKGAAAWGRLRRRFSRQRTITIWGDMVDGPYGGASQVLKGIRGELARRGYRVLHNSVEAADGHIMNSVFFNVAKAREVVRGGGRRPLVVHRVDGPISLYRGREDGLDAQIFEFNREVATATAFQSYYSWRESVRLGFTAVNPTIIRNACDPAIFHPGPRAGRDAGGRRPRVRLISASWSTNPRKGFDVYEYLDAHLDFSRFEYVFVGRSPVPFRNIRLVDAMPSGGVAEELRAADIFITASRNDPASNALLEAIACGLPVLYADSGGHGEIASYAGVRFSEPSDVPVLLERVLQNVDAYRLCGYTPSLGAMVDAYLALLQL